MKEKKIGKVEKLVCGIKIKKYVVHIKALKQALNHGLILKKAHTVIQFNQNTLTWILNYEKKKKMNLKRISLS